MLYQKVLDPTNGFVLSWVLLLTIIIVVPVNYENSIEPLTLAYIVVCVLCFYFGTKLIKVTKRVVYIERQVSSISIIIIAIFSLSYLCLIIYDALQNNMMAMIISGELSSLREAHWASLEEEKNIIDYMKSITLPFSMIASLLLVLKRNSILQLLGLFSIFSILITGLVLGGRALIVFTIIMIAVAFVLSSPPKAIIKSKIIKIILLSVLFVILFYVTFIWWPVARNQDLINSYDTYLYLNTSAHISAGGEEMASILGKEIVYPFVFSMTYFTSSPFIFDIYFTESDISSWYKLGSYHFPFLGGVINSGDNTYSWLEIRENIGDVTGSLGLNRNFWATGIRDYIIDFGVFLTPFFMFVFGFLSKLLYKHALTKSNFIYLALYANIALLWIFFPYMSLLIVGPIRNMLFVLLALLLIENICRELGREKETGFNNKGMQ